MPEPRFIWVKDPDTRHEFDLPEGHHLIRKGLVTPVKGNRFPPSPIARRPKHHITKSARHPAGSVGGQPAAQDATDERTES